MRGRSAWPGSWRKSQTFQHATATCRQRLQPPTATSTYRTQATAPQPSHPSSEGQHPYGGASVNRLVGSARLSLSLPGYSIVPLLPGADLPFGASIEVLQPGCSSAPPIDPARQLGQLQQQDLLDVYYVLTGDGQVRGADGLCTPVRAGDCLVTWHNSTQLVCSASCPTTPDGLLQPPLREQVQQSELQQAQPAQQSLLAALRFHMPASLILPQPTQGNSTGSKHTHHDPAPASNAATVSSDHRHSSSTASSTSQAADTAAAPSAIKAAAVAAETASSQPAVASSADTALASAILQLRHRACLSSMDEQVEESTSAVSFLTPTDAAALMQGVQLRGDWAMTALHQSEGGRGVLVPPSSSLDDADGFSPARSYSEADIPGDSSSNSGSGSASSNSDSSSTAGDSSSSSSSARSTPRQWHALDGVPRQLQQLLHTAAGAGFAAWYHWSHNSGANEHGSNGGNRESMNSSNSSSHAVTQTQPVNQLQPPAVPHAQFMQHTVNLSSPASSSTTSATPPGVVADAPSTHDQPSGANDREYHLPGAIDSNTSSVLMQRPLEEFRAFRFPAPQTNRLAFVFDPVELGLSMSFGVEVFEPGHVTPIHSHAIAHELFFVLGGRGIAVCNGVRWAVEPGDCLVFPPQSKHGIDNVVDSGRLYCLQLMAPNEDFVEFVTGSGQAAGRLEDRDLCTLASQHC